jgi:hypothetical protein
MDGYPCYLSDLESNPCPNNISPKGEIAYIIHPKSDMGRFLHAQVTGHWENYRMFCSSACADRAKASWAKASKSSMDAHIAKIRSLVEDFRKECESK